MSSSSSSSSSWISRLAEDSLLEIFLRSSVKSVGACKCVSKLWLKLLTSPHFPKLYLDRSISIDSHRFLIALYDKHGFYSLSCDSFDEIQALPTPRESLFYTKGPYVIGSCNGSISCNSFDEILALPTPKQSLFYRRIPYVIGSCNGLICLSDIYTTYTDTCMYIWNPVTNECVEIHWPPSMFKPKSSDLWRDIVLGFGYSHDEYKVIRMEFVYDKDAVCDRGAVMVHTLGTDSWRVIEVRKDLPISNNTSFADVNGVLHWVPYVKLGSIVSFHVGDEKPGDVSWPVFDKQPHYSDLHLGVLHGCLSVFRRTSTEGVDVWVMKEYGVKDSWTRMFSIGLSNLNRTRMFSIGLSNLNRTRMSSNQRSRCPMYRIDLVTDRKNGEIILLINDSEFVLYDPVRESCGSLKTFPGIRDFGFKTIKYVESLTSVVALVAGSSGENQQ